MSYICIRKVRSVYGSDAGGNYKLKQINCYGNQQHWKQRRRYLECN